MVVGKVTGMVVCTQKNETLQGKSMLVVQPLNMHTMEPAGAPVVALDAVGAGKGEVVMLVGGSSARNANGFGKVAVDQSIVGILDSITIGDEMVFKKQLTVES